MQRINVFLEEEEVPAWASSLTSPCPTNSTQTLIGFSKATFEWHALTRKPDHRRLQFRLGPLDLHFPVGQLSLVTGATGSGKSAILAALLGGKYEINL